MRKLLFFTLILLISAGWAVAQNPTSPPMTENPGAQNPSTPGSQPGMTGQPGQQQPGMPGEVGQQPGVPGAQTGQTGQETSPSAAGSTVEGCLGGSAGNFNIIDKSGVSYRLDIPAGADTSKLNQHIGEEVRVTGAMNNTGAAGASDTTSAGAAGSAAGAAGGPSIAVTKIDKIADKCSTNINKPGSSQQ
ncbi:MAG: hypothetical protein ROO76_20600 [Terriglobia bacterium]|jgi:hypothetical protein|nr:hypothetical protein [Terriglobia bacterium]